MQVLTEETVQFGMPDYNDDDVDMALVRVVATLRRLPAHAIHHRAAVLAYADRLLDLRHGR
jgi:hypothetical protein